MHSKENQFLVTRYYEHQSWTTDTAHGIYWYKKEKENWILQKRLPLAYGWGVSIIEDKYLVYVVDGELHQVTLEAIGVGW